MRHRKHTFKIGRRPAHTRSLLSNQVCSLILGGRIETTITKAKETRRLAERMVTLAKKGTLHHRRLAITALTSAPAEFKTAVITKLFGEIADAYREREGGYTRIIRIGTRRGDASEMCYLEWVEAGKPAAAAKKKRSSKKKAAPTKGAEAAAEAAEGEVAAATEGKAE